MEGKAKDKSSGKKSVLKSSLLMESMTLKSERMALKNTSYIDLRKPGGKQNEHNKNASTTDQWIGYDNVKHMGRSAMDVTRPVIL